MTDGPVGLTTIPVDRIVGSKCCIHATYPLERHADRLGPVLQAISVLIKDVDPALGVRDAAVQKAGISVVHEEGALGHLDAEAVWLAR